MVQEYDSAASCLDPRALRILMITLHMSDGKDVGVFKGTRLGHVYSRLLPYISVRYDFATFHQKGHRTRHHPSAPLIPGKHNGGINDLQY